jgi:hypothetical protein
MCSSPTEIRNGTARYFSAVARGTRAITSRGMLVMALGRAYGILSCSLRQAASSSSVM